jgi:glycerophosphoryl diester phosphodiesterase
MPIILFAAAACAASCSSPAPESHSPPTLIAHAGGIGNHRTYTNSLEALDRSAARGYPAVEIDFSWTRDDRVVLLHDWVRDVPRLFDQPPGRMSLDEFRSARSAGGLTLLTLDDLEPWFEDNPEILVFTDFKERTVEGLRRLAEAYSHQVHRIVPQIYQPDELESVRDLGFDSIVLTLYDSDLDDNAVVDFASRNRLFGVTMPIRRALSSDLPERLSEIGIPLFVHTVNDYPTFLELQARGISGVYTDWLTPGDADAQARPEEWSIETDDREAIGFRAISFVPSNMAGLEISLEFRNHGTVSEPVRVALVNPDGAELTAAAMKLQPGDQKRLNAVDLFPPSVDHGWIRIDAASGVLASSTWKFRDNPGIIRALESATCSRFVARGAGAGVSGLLVAVINPTALEHTYSLRRTIGSDQVDEETAALGPDRQLIRVYRSSTDENIEIEIEGGPMMPMILRWDPLVRFIE